MKISLGIGLTTKCNCNCPHCYSRTGKDEFINFEELKEFCNVYEISSVNFGTGESIFHPDYFEILEYFNEKNIKMSLTTNGYTASLMSDAQLKMLNDIDFSLDFADEALHDSFRGANQFKLVLEQIERCKRLGVETSIAFCLLNRNCEHLESMLKLTKELAINFRINIYKPVHTDKFTLSYDEFWGSIKYLMANSKLISCSEPIVNVALRDNNCAPHGHPCGQNSIRVKPSGKVVSCVYMNNGDVYLKDLIDFAKENNKDDVFTIINKGTCFERVLPEECKDCEHKELCGGGCLSRRILSGNNSYDEYCFIKRNEQIEIPHEWEETEKDLVHSSYLCTLIVKA